MVTSLTGRVLRYIRQRWTRRHYLLQSFRKLLVLSRLSRYDLRLCYSRCKKFSFRNLVSRMVILYSRRALIWKYVRGAVHLIVT
ncbi:hypothetical protein BDR03DRAFT_944240 [Suillus americanus]|nr:hypothetical protein BDR03DRAFT_944240 [Suillus americanus]